MEKDRIIVEEFYKKEKDIIFRYYRFNEEGEWIKQETFLKEKPCVIITFRD